MEEKQGGASAVKIESVRMQLIARRTGFGWIFSTYYIKCFAVLAHKMKT